MPNIGCQKAAASRRHATATMHGEDIIGHTIRICHAVATCRRRARYIDEEMHDKWDMISSLIGFTSRRLYLY